MPFLTGTMYMIALAGPFYIMYIGYQFHVECGHRLYDYRICVTA